MIRLSRISAVVLLLPAACGLVTVGKSSQQLRATNLGFEDGAPGIGIPSAWSPGNANMTQYEWATDSDEKRSGSQALRIRSIASDASGFGGVTQCVEPPNETSTLQYSGFLKTKDVSGSTQESGDSGAGLWIRIGDQSGTRDLVFDNMYSRWGPGEDQRVDNRRVYGTSDWVGKTVKLTVPSKRGKTCFGVLLSSSGILWADDLKLEYTS
jgi:hypothetical protein